MIPITVKACPFNRVVVPDYSWIPMKSLLPETVTDYYNLLPARAVFLRKEATAEQSRHFRSLKKDERN